MNDPRKLAIKEYDYDLPAHRIADYPLSQRDQSKILIQHPTNSIGEDLFFNVGNYLPADSLLVLNNTKVVHARLIFQKSTGAQIEIFCLEPADPDTSVEIAFDQNSPVIWKCFVGNARKWKEQPLKMELENGELRAEKIRPDGNSWHIKFSWDIPGMTWAEILEQKGHVPLPPYIKREDNPEDRLRYQTVFAQKDGSVAAPTAGLHFTPEVLKSLDQKNIHQTYLTLHVGAGTFKPVSEEGISQHQMHQEQVVISRETIEKLQGYEQQKIIPVGTTSVRTLESAFWFANRLKANFEEDFLVEQWEPYDSKVRINRQKALELLLKKMDSLKTDYLAGQTSLMIAPGYEFKMLGGMITNFHQPRSTLLLLIAAFLGSSWKDVYQYALDNDFRFLSYGDSCVFLPRRL